MGYRQRGRKLSYNALKGMKGQQVLVHDLELDIFDQLCTVDVIETPWYNKRRTGFAVSNIILRNEEYEYVYNAGGSCRDGEFECYAVKEGK